jgi:hypothetical protein
MIPYMTKYLNTRPDEDNGHTWVSQRSQKESSRYDKSNNMPPGMDITEQKGAKKVTHAEPYIPGITETSVRKGYKFQAMSATEEMYSDENRIPFHETDEGFVERNNYMDRI